MIKRARPRYAVPFEWAVRYDGMRLWDILHQRRAALLGGIPRGLTPGVPDAPMLCLPRKECSWAGGSGTETA